VKKVGNPLDKHIQSDQVLASERFQFHLANSTVSFYKYRQNQRHAIFVRVQSKHIIYLDTNAWKCLSDYERGKTLTDAMNDFARTMNSDQIRNNCVFPIGIATLLELLSMGDPVSLSTLATVIKKFSMDVGCQPPDMIISQELALFKSKETRDAGVEPERFCHPMEIMGELEIHMPNPLPAAEMLAFKKTILDFAYALPATALLEMSAYVDKRWNNTAGIDDMNQGMIIHQHEINTFPDAIFVELTGIMKFHVPENAPLINGYTPQKALAFMAMCHWHKEPYSRNLITARILANLYSVIRYTKNRKFRKGDIADFVTGQIALPSAHALFTDAAFANLLNGKEIGLKDFCSCKVVSGFNNFVTYLKTSIEKNEASG
jgi:hypothetical protein